MNVSKRLDTIEARALGQRVRNPAMAAALAKLSTPALMELREIIAKREAGSALTAAESARVDELMCSNKSED